MLKINLIANYLGQGWVALMSLAFIPLYINYLGIEAYGLIGLFAVLNAWLSLLDIGMTPMLSREMGRFTGGSHSAQAIRDLLRSVEVITFGIALFIAGAVAVGSNWIASSWLRADALPVDVVAQAFMIMGLVAALRFAESIYRSSIVGLQRQVVFNAVNSALATVRGVGGVAILLWISPTIHAFFLWQGVASIITLITLAWITYRSLPRIGRMAQFSFDALRSVWRFAGGMMAISLLALLLTQVDKILLSKLLSLSEFGYYTLAAAVAGALYMLVQPITQAVYPRLCELHSRGDATGIAEVYHKSAQLVSVVTGSAGIVIIMFSETFLRLWTRDTDLALRMAPLLSLLMLGNLLNALMWVPYQAQLAHGWTSLTIKVNIVAVLGIVPALLWVTPHFGAEGAAWLWVVLNAGYVSVTAHFMFRRILNAEKWRWYTQDLLAPLSASTASSVLLKLAWPHANSALSELILLAVAATLTGSASLLATGLVRRQLQNLIKSWWRQKKTNHGS